MPDVEGEIALNRVGKRLWFSTPDGRGDNGYSKRILEEIYDRYKGRLGEKATTARFHFFKFPLLVNEHLEVLGGKFLGPSSPARAKIDGVFNREAEEEWKTTRPTLDGVWDFSEFGILYIISNGHLNMEFDSHPESAELVLAVEGADLQGFRDEVYRQVRKTILGLGGIIEVPYRSGSHRRLPLFAADDVILGGKVQEEILRDIALFMDREWYAQNGLKWRRGLILYGPPGNGKTVTTKMMAGRFLQLGVPVFQLTISSYMDGDDFKGVLRNVSKFKPAMLIIEDLESILKADMSRNEMLTILDDTEEEGALSGLFMVATTNYPEKLDKAIIGRSGRFDKIYKIDYPKAAARRAYLASLKRSEAYGPHHELIVTKTEGMAMAVLNELHYQILSAARGDEQNTPAHILAAIERLKTVEKSKRTEEWREEDGGIGFRAADNEA